MKLNLFIECERWLETNSKKQLENLFLYVLGKAEGILQLTPVFCLDLSLIDSKKMMKLNLKYRGKNSSTDVLSFPLYEKKELIDKKLSVPLLIGDIVISYDDAVAEADSYGENFPHCVIRLFIHGLLHLLGFDHESGDLLEKKMYDIEEKILDASAELVSVCW